LHSTYGTGDARQVAFDVFRLENGQLAEHWDALQDWVDEDATVSGNTLVDGETEVTDRHLTEQNQELVTTMVREVFIESQVERLADYIGEPYIQHNPRAGNGLVAVQAFFAAVQAQGVQLGYTASPLVVADGNFVLVGSEGYLGDAMTDYTVFYDLFRVDAGKLVEHWDVIQAVDPSTVPHANGLF
jgi:predicted SnoaL-like aldol condensation-catalyzing enzyme